MIATNILRKGALPYFILQIYRLASLSKLVDKMLCGVIIYVHIYSVDKYDVCYKNISIKILYSLLLLTELF